mgnify:CR=1 FL=1
MVLHILLCIIANKFYKSIRFDTIYSMKKALLLLLPFLLGSCTATPKEEETNTQTTPSTQEEQHQELPTEQEEQHQEEHTEGGGTQTEEEHTQGGGTQTEEEHTDDEGGGSGTGGGTETGGNTEGGGGQQEETNGISLDEWREYEFHDGHEPVYHEDWDFYYGTTFEPMSNCLWKNPNEKVDYSGIEFFDKKQYMESPIFKSYVKLEVRFQFWFSSHQSTKYKATKNEPQFKIEEYNSKNVLINTDPINIEKSDIPKNNTALERKIYIHQNTMTHFNLRFNNFIENGDSGYTAILCKISLKGWDYE